jgi:hypothetical protein
LNDAIYGVAAIFVVAGGPLMLLLSADAAVPPVDSNYYLFCSWHSTLSGDLYVFMSTSLPLLTSLRLQLFLKIVHKCASGSAESRNEMII